MAAKRIQYTRLHQFAAGGMAVLTLGVQPDGHKLVVRELHPKLRWNLRKHLAFMRGARIREAVSPHAHVVFPIERGYNRLVPYEVIEYVHGANLNDLIIRRDPLVKASAMDILYQACVAVAHVHDQGFLHLDVKPENFLVDTSRPEFRIKLTDFDLSCRDDGSRNARRSGTKAYMSPELLRHGAVGVEADIFAFGVLAYFLVTGRKPFAGHSIRETFRQQLSQDFQVTEPVKMQSEISPKLNRAIMQCLERDPDKRFPCMLFLQKELERM
jgi:serine/threonine-protein kinase